MEKKTLEEALNEAEAKAWAALANYKFMMFGYWAAIWVHLNSSPSRRQVAACAMRSTSSGVK